MRPTFKRLALAVKASAVTTAAVTTMFAAPDAHAASSSTFVAKTKWVEGCEAILYGNSQSQASAGVYMSTKWTSSVYCVGWLERSDNRGSSWYQISAGHTVQAGESAYTAWYSDSYPKLARACVESTTHEGSRTTACTAAW